MATKQSKQNAVIISHEISQEVTTTTQQDPNRIYRDIKNLRSCCRFALGWWIMQSSAYPSPAFASSFLGGLLLYGERIVRPLFVNSAHRHASTLWKPQTGAQRTLASKLAANGPVAARGPSPLHLGRAHVAKSKNHHTPKTPKTLKNQNYPCWIRKVNSKDFEK